MGKAELAKVSPPFATGVPIWGFHGPCTIADVKSAVVTIAASMSGTGNVINIMSGTHGCCSGAVGAVATPEQKFAAEDRALAGPTTKDGKSVTLNVVDFNLDAITKDTMDPVSTAMSMLNGAMRDIHANSSGQQSFLLAYCCSAGTK